jgi:hypothetical protein
LTNRLGGLYSKVEGDSKERLNGRLGNLGKKIAGGMAPRSPEGKEFEGLPGSKKATATNKIVESRFLTAAPGQADPVPRQQLAVQQQMVTKQAEAVGEIGRLAAAMDRMANRFPAMTPRNVV